MSSIARSGGSRVESGSRRGTYRCRCRVRGRGAHPLRQGGQRLRRDKGRRPRREGVPRTAAAQSRPPAGAHRRRGGRRHHPDGRPGYDHRADGRPPGRTPEVRAGLLDRSNVRRGHDRGHDPERRDHGRRLRRRAGRRRREHVTAPDGRGHGPQPPVPLRAHRRPRRAQHGGDRGEPA